MTDQKAALIGLKSIRIEDSFWNQYTRLVTREIIPYQWKALNDEVEDADPSHCIKNFKIAAGLLEGNFQGAVFQDTDVAKWLEAVAYSLSYEPNEALEKTADEVIELIGKAQDEDGYLDTFFRIQYPKNRFTNLREGHELYTAGHMIEAAVAYYEVTKKSRFLDIMKKCADHICEVFHTPRYQNAVPGHEEIELALIRLYHVTGEKKYLGMAREFVDRRGTTPNYLLTEHENPDWIDIFHDQRPFFPEYSQCHKPVREQKEAVGHAVRAVYLYCAMADLAYEYKDAGLLRACENLYENMTEKRMYLTGGIGSSGMYERFTTDYDLPNDRGYNESCASIGLALFCRRMLQITRDRRYADTMERALMNTVLAGIALDGKSFFYVNPLEVWPKNCMDHTSMDHVKPVRQKWFSCACCPPNIARTLASLGEYVCMEDENTLWIQLHVGSQIHTVWNHTEVSVQITTDMPFGGTTAIHVEAKMPVSGKLMLRIPDYAVQPEIQKGKEKLQNVIQDGYATLAMDGETMADFYLHFSMQPHFVYANTKVRADAGRVAVQMGPLVYCMEEVDNGGNLSEIHVDTEAPLAVAMKKMPWGKSAVIYTKGYRLKNPLQEEKKLYHLQKPEKEETEIQWIPYCYWGNRMTGEMAVWGNTEF